MEVVAMVKPWFFRPLHPQSSLPYDIPLNHHFSWLLWGLLGQTKIDGEHPWFPVRNMIYKWWVSTLLCLQKGTIWRFPMTVWIGIPPWSRNPHIHPYTPFVELTTHWHPNCTQRVAYCTHYIPLNPLNHNHLITLMAGLHVVQPDRGRHCRCLGSGCRGHGGRTRGVHRARWKCGSSFFSGKNTGLWPPANERFKHFFARKWRDLSGQNYL